MEVIITIGAALRSEKTKKACRINQCSSFTKLALKVKDLQNHAVHDDKTASIKCSEFAIEVENSSPNWSDVINYTVDGDLVKFTAAKGYIFGPIIPGYQ
jgi:hypothetical protein